MKIKLTHQDLVDMSDYARQAYVDQPPRLELPGQPLEGIQERERRALAWLDAATRILGRHGVRTIEGPLVDSGTKTTVWEV